MKLTIARRMKRIGTALSLLTALITGTFDSIAQLNPLPSIYYLNQYLANPAMAGLDDGLNVNIGYRRQWNAVPGAPVTQSLTGDYGLNNKKVGVGLSIYQDKAGLLQRTKVMGTYAYHLPVGTDGQKLNFGLSLGLMNERVRMEDLSGDPGDEALGRFNDKKMFADVNFGVSYTSEKLTLQGAIPTMRSRFNEDERDAINRSVWFMAASYKISFPQSFSDLGVEPKLCFRGVKGYDNIVDVGARITYAHEKITLMSMYHTTKNTTFGLGAKFKEMIMVTAIYTTPTSAMNAYVSGNVEIGLRAHLF